MPDIVLVHGDVSTTFATALACYYLQIPVGHVEAGLRTYDIYSPYPEEYNCQAVGVISRYHFAPTESAKSLLRENLGETMKHMFRAIRRVCDEQSDIKVIYPIHMNLMVHKTAQEILGDDRIHIIEPRDALDFHNFLAHSYRILADSGGIQEEAPSLGKPVLVMRDTTERPEGITAGTLKVIGTDEQGEQILQGWLRIKTDRISWKKFSR